MIPSTLLCTRKSDGMLDEKRQLWRFNDVYKIDVCHTSTPIFTMYPLLSGVHVSDKHICIPPEVFFGKQNDMV